MRPTANYSIIVDREKFVLLLDMGPWDKFKTITNAAEDVVFDMYAHKGLGHRRLFYVDSDGDITQLVHDGNGNFIDFRAAGDPRDTVEEDDE